ncbi:MAG: hypothetical protein KAU90_06700, partial [Sulfurovaceae bacterium]|nr:hypothetical protein [Sulfurovaceae bacterium]
MLNYKEYVEKNIEKFILKTGVARNNTFNSEVLKENLEKEITPILERFEIKIQEISEEIIMPLEIILKINNIIVGQEINSKITPINFELLENDTLTFSKIEGIEKIEGLEWDVKNQKIIGKATCSGDFTLIAYGLFQSNK